MSNDIGKIIEKRRKELKLSYRKLSELTGLSHSHISSIEKGIEPKTNKPVRPSLETIEKLAKGLNVSIEFLLGKVLRPEINIDYNFNNTVSQIKEDNLITELYPRIMEKYETMELNEKETKAYEYLKNMPQDEVEQDLQRIINKLKSLPAEQRKALELIIDSLFPSSK